MSEVDVRVRPDSARTDTTTFQRLARSRVLRQLDGLDAGRLVIHDPLGTVSVGDRDAPRALSATVHVPDAAMWTELATRGALGAGEAYARGLWNTDDLTAVLRVFLRNRSVLAALDGGAARFSRWVLRGLLALSPNTRRRARHDIAAHYDLGNDFFTLFLDETMTYSAGIFPSPDATLAEASIEKYDRICRELELTAAHHVLEIGCGWAGFAEFAAARYGCRVTGTTISKAQYDYATERIERAGLSDRVTLVMQDYRDLEGTYDRVVSIEMIEAVGHQNLGRYVRVIADRLTSDGRAAVQAITIADEHYDRARKTMDFIKRHIFPGSTIPSRQAIAEALERETDLRITGDEDIGRHYAETLRQWDARLTARADEARALGKSETFLRAWHYYFCYCEAGFREQYLRDLQLILER